MPAIDAQYVDKWVKFLRYQFFINLIFGWEVVAFIVTNSWAPRLYRIAVRCKIAIVLFLVRHYDYPALRWTPNSLSFYASSHRDIPLSYQKSQWDRHRIVVRCKIGLIPYPMSLMRFTALCQGTKLWSSLIKNGTAITILSHHMLKLGFHFQSWFLKGSLVYSKAPNSWKNKQD